MDPTRNFDYALVTVAYIPRGNSQCNVSRVAQICSPTGYMAKPVKAFVTADILGRWNGSPIDRLLLAKFAETCIRDWLYRDPLRNCSRNNTCCVREETKDVIRTGGVVKR
jgi:hypothetical protein